MTFNHTLITRQFSRTIWTKYIKALEEYDLIANGDIIYLPPTTEPKQLLANGLVEMTAQYGMRDITIVRDANEPHNKTVALDSFHDIIYNNLWEMLYNGRIHSKLPKTHTEASDKSHKEQVTTIRPLFFVRDEHILEWQQATGEDFATATNHASNEETITQQLALIKSLVDKLAANNDAVENNIFASMSNVDIEMLPGHIIDKEHHSFLEWYDE